MSDITPGCRERTNFIFATVIHIHNLINFKRMYISTHPYKFAHNITKFSQTDIEIIVSLFRARKLFHLLHFHIDKII